jgi:peptidoglycan/xylan/chitin deacetylase (PgdA/CDA1 family)
MSLPLLIPWCFRRPAVALALFCALLPSCDKLKQVLPKQPPVKAEAVAETPAPEEIQAAKPAEAAELFGPAKPDEPEAAKAEPFELNKSSMVSVLLYHDFVERIPRTEMMVSVPTFRAQMQALKDASIPVIPMADLLAWKRGEKNIPDECVVITLDDGWVGEHELAFPILKEFGYPFTIYLYKKYVNSGGRSMTIAQIKDMLANGGELGSHSISHQPLAMKKGKADEAYHAWLHEEIAGSKKWLEETFGVPCRTFAYPYGNKNDEVVQLAVDAGYEGAVTVNPQKVTWDTPIGKLGRFTQQWDKDTNFKLAVSFHGRNDVASSKFVKTDAVDEQGHKMFDLKPEPNSTVIDRRPVIEAGLARLGGVVPESVMLRVGGFGAVPAEFDAAAQTVRYQIPQKLRVEECTATLAFRRADSEKDEVVSWKFKIDQKASYLPPPDPVESKPADGAPQPAPAPETVMVNKAS